MIPNRIASLASLALLITAISCSDATSPGAKVPTFDPERPTATATDSARQRWRAQNLHTYAFTIQYSCFCGNVHPLYVVVLNDTVSGVLDLVTGQQVDARLGYTVEGLFAFIQNAVDHSAQLIRASYDPVKGFPTAIDYDGAAQLADDEMFIRASDVHPITPGF